MAFVVRCESWTSRPLSSREKAELVKSEIERVGACTDAHEIVEVSEMTTTTDLIEAAHRQGVIDGRAAGAWVTDGNTTETTYRVLLDGIENGDPLITDEMLPAAPPPMVVLDVLRSELGVRYSEAHDGEHDHLVEEYVAGFAEGAEEVVTASCRYHLGLNDPERTCRRGTQGCSVDHRGNESCEPF